MLGLEYRVEPSVALDVIGAGPTARTLRALALDRARPRLAFRGEAVSMIRTLGLDLGAASA